MEQIDLENKLADALESAFYNQETLGSMIRRAIKTDLGKIKQDASSIAITAEEVTKYAFANGKVILLLIGASKENSGNSKLKHYIRNNFQQLLKVFYEDFSIDFNEKINEDFLSLLVEALLKASENKGFQNDILVTCKVSVTNFSP
ncbi:hypothetical protein IQ260_21735 [Leptolyngbya cf. ectocarpi LEGE 11479]|uniref:Effector-associated domain-containing protein n=1 Tax=Leptolyngbya cf. ectocarpi LEGE 11479 TaxID=1828722 RepID=A0A928ZXJ2_LEPEC|nr:effector-associated domain EAD1-containing protein [Leptolyngbya ectocarpi]MBE9069268.1 hypothetical protein [Leptolyngbya cf. ectocarpi LEGE 11479]